jgi:hypothetical protein
MKRKSDKLLGENIWDIETSHFIHHTEADPAMARAWTIFRWMYFGDLHPLAAAIREDGALDKFVLVKLADMIDEGHITAKRRTPFHPATSTREEVARIIYDYQITEGKTPTEAVQLTARMIGRGEEYVRAALKPSRNKGKKVST